MLAAIATINDPGQLLFPAGRMPSHWRSCNQPPVSLVSVKIILALMADREHGYGSCVFNLEQGDAACCAKADDNFPKERITRCCLAAAER